LLLYTRVVSNVTLCFTPLSHLLWPPIYTLFRFYLQSKEILLNLGMKCSNLAFNAQGSGVIILLVLVRAVKIYVAAVEALEKKERQYETQFTTKIARKFSLSPSYFLL
jgi:hypothetical protein